MEDWLAVVHVTPDSGFTGVQPNGNEFGGGLGDGAGCELPRYQQGIVPDVAEERLNDQVITISGSVEHSFCWIVRESDQRLSIVVRVSFALGHQAGIIVVDCQVEVEGHLIADLGLSLQQANNWIPNCRLTRRNAH